MLVAAKFPESLYYYAGNFFYYAGIMLYAFQPLAIMPKIMPA